MNIKLQSEGRNSTCVLNSLAAQRRVRVVEAQPQQACVHSLGTQSTRVEALTVCCGVIGAELQHLRRVDQARVLHEDLPFRLGIGALTGELGFERDIVPRRFELLSVIQIPAE